MFLVVEVRRAMIPTPSGTRVPRWCCCRPVRSQLSHALAFPSWSVYVNLFNYRAI